MRLILILALLEVFAPPALAQYYLPTYRYANPNDLQTQVANWYRRFLNREPDPSGLATWVESLRSSNAPERTLATILGSAEYYAKGGNTPDGFIRTLYRDLLGRDATEGELAFWMRRIYHQDRTDVAYAFLMRYPQSWQSSPALAAPPTVAVPAEVDRYEYRRPYWHNWHERLPRSFSRRAERTRAERTRAALILSPTRQ